MRLLFACTAFIATLIGTPGSALSLKDAIVYVLETNPNIEAAEANKQAIEFELDRAGAFRAPEFRLESWAGTSRDFGSDSTGPGSPVNGWEVSGIVSQRLFDGFWTRSEIERQAYRVDAAALRVMERSEFLALEATRLYADVLRMQQQVALARANISYHEDAVARLQNAFNSGAVGPGDLTQSEERLLVARDILLDFELQLKDTKAGFLEIVGVDPKQLGTVPSVSGAVPATLEDALSTGRRVNPTIRLLQADVGAAEALSRRVDSNRFPTINLEAEGRYGDDLDGVDGRVNDFRAGIALRYNFQGGANRADRQEHARRVNEARANLLSQTRLVEREMRQSWNTMEQVRQRLRLLEQQVSELRTLRQTYEEEFAIGTRSLLDVLNTQNALVRAEAELINMRSLNRYVDYRVIAALGILLPTLGIEPPEDAKVYARQLVDAPPVNAAETGKQFDAKAFRNWRKKAGE